MSRRLALIHIRGGAVRGWRDMLRQTRWPRLARLAAAGALVELEPFSFQGAAASVSVATGCLPDAHGVLLDEEIRPDGLALRPASCERRRRSTVWEIAHRHGLAAAAVGWPATHPARPGDGVIVTDRFAVHNSRRADSWPMDDGCVQPESMRAELSELRLSALDITGEQIGALAPGCAGVDQGREDVVVQLGAALARCASDHAVGTFLAERFRPDLFSVHFSLADVAARLRAEWRPGPGSDPHALDDAPYDALRFVDLAIGRYMHLCGPEATYLISADATAGEIGEGFLIGHGPGVRAGEAGRASLIDVAPTALALLGIEQAWDIDGCAIEAVLDLPAPSGQVWTHEPPPPYVGATSGAETERHKAMLEDLRALGFGPPALRAAEGIAKHRTALAQSAVLASLARSHWRERQRSRT
ncbi:MAG: alkaline phosphatase family protein [Phycisphaerales bacterium]|nr:alkaline phosphatase family protein [Phycisphaerales bacterium]